MEFNTDEILFRCSGLGHLMVEPKEKSPLTKYEEAKEYLKQLKLKPVPKDGTKAQLQLLTKISDTEKKLKALHETKHEVHLAEGVKVHLMNILVAAKRERREDIKSKYLKKGNQREQDSLSLLRLECKRFYKHNTNRYTNGYLTGEPDAFEFDKDDKIIKTVDTKTSWSANTFYQVKIKELNPLYYWQGMGYMELTGAKSHTVAYCLVNGTPDVILQEKYYAARELGIIDETIADERTQLKYKEKCIQIEKNHIFDITSFRKEVPGFDFHGDPDNWKDIPRDKRIYLLEFDYDEVEIQRLYQRIEESRKYLALINNLV